MRSTMATPRHYAVIGPLPSGTETRAFLGCEVVDGRPRLESPVVVAWLPDGATGDTKQVARLQREIAFASQLNHPNVVRVHGLECFTEGWARIMDDVDGASIERFLATILERGISVPPKVAARMIADACEGVITAHEQARPIIHGAIRPDTLLIAFDGRTLVGGFGSAFMSAPADLPRERATYLSPEQVIGGSAAVGLATDVYGLGAVLYTLLTGVPPFSPGDDLESSIITVPPTRPQLEGAASSLFAVAEQAMAKRTQQRYASAAAMRAAIAGAMADDGLASHAEVAAFVGDLIPPNAPERAHRLELLQLAHDPEALTTLSRPESPPSGVDPALFAASRPSEPPVRSSAPPPPPTNGETAPIRAAVARDAVTLTDGRPPPSGDEGIPPQTIPEFPSFGSEQLAENTDRILRRAKEMTQRRQAEMAASAKPESTSTSPQFARPRIPQMGTVMSETPQAQDQITSLPPHAQPAVVPAAPASIPQPVPQQPMHPMAPVSMPPGMGPVSLPPNAIASLPPMPYGMPQMQPGVVPQYPQGMPQMQQMQQPMPGMRPSMPPGMQPGMVPPGMVPHGMVPPGMMGRPSGPPQQGFIPHGHTPMGSLPPGVRSSVPSGRASVPPPNARNSIGGPKRSSMPAQPIAPVPRAPMRDISSITAFSKDAGDSSRSILYIGLALLVGIFIIFFAFPKDPPPGLGEEEEAARHKLPKELVQAALQGKADAPEMPSSEPEEPAPVSPLAAPVAPSGAAPAEPPLTYGYLSVSSEPPVDVYDGSVLIGKTPFKVKLDVGQHKLRFTDRAKLINIYKRYNIKPGGEHKDAVSFGTSRLVVEAPDGAAVSLNGKAVGRAPIDPQTIYEGRYLLKVVYEGKSWSETFDAPAGREIKYTVRMGQ
jgi:serine/threonine protein kinase